MTGLFPSTFINVMESKFPITFDSLADGAVTTDKLADSAVTAGKLGFDVKPIIASTNTDSAVGVVGQLHYNTTDNVLSMCTSIDEVTATDENITTTTNLYNWQSSSPTLIIANSDPGDSTPGYVGQLYFNTNTKILYVCVPEIQEGTPTRHVWYPVTASASG